MMIKKKTAAKEEPANKKEIETTENKENSNIDKVANKSVDGDTPETGKGDQTSQAQEKEIPADKVVPPEKAIEEKLAEMQDKYIRLSAEFDNYRKRTLREKMELSKYASENLLNQILPFMDDFERAMKNMEEAKDCTAVKEGIDLIHSKFNEFLKQSGVSEIEALNHPFNFDLHDAVAKIAVEEEDKKGQVVDVVLKGYYLLDKVIRHSKVVVGE